ncbi:hypothetical protein ACA910_005044 [Epithemia clementina (nom. ined.)]
MGLPIALGSKSVSNRPITTYVHHVGLKQDDQGRRREALPVEAGSPQLPAPIVASAITRDHDGTTCDTGASSSHPSSYYDGEWHAIVCLYFFKLEKTISTMDYHYEEATDVPTIVVAEFRVQIAPAAEPFSNQQHPETIYNVHLPLRTTDTLYFPDPSYSIPLLVAHFSADRRSLVCVFSLPQEKSPQHSNHHTRQQQPKTMTVLFPLRRGIAVSSAPPRPPLPLPSYLAGTNSTSNQTTTDDSKSRTGGVPIAAEPKIIVNDHLQKSKKGLIIDNISSLCNVCFAEGKKSFLLAGDLQGSIRVIVPHPLSLSKPVQIVTSNPSHDNCSTITSSDNVKQHEENGIMAIQAVTEGYVGDSYQGYLAVVDLMGQVSCWNWQLTRGPSEGDDDEMLDEIPLIIGSLGSLWFFRLRRLLWRIPAIDQQRVNQIQWVTPWHLACLSLEDPHQYRHDKASQQRQQHSSVIVNVWGWTAYDKGGNHGRMPVRRSTLKLDKQEVIETASTFCMPDMAGRKNKRTYVQSHLDHDAATGCLIISSTFDVDEEHTTAMSEPDQNIAASTTTKLPFVVVWNWKLNVKGFTLYHSEQASLGRAESYCNVLSHLCMATDYRGRRRFVHILSCPNAHKCSIQKDIYETGTLSPLSQQRHFRYYKPILPETPLLLTNESVSYPYASKLTATGDYQIEWKDTMIPKDHSDKLESNAPILACIGRRGLSVAVAGRKFGLCALEEVSRCSTRKRTRWHRFSNDLNERSFRVLAMTWWEGRSGSKAIEDFMTEDLLVAVVAVSTNGGGKDAVVEHYLSCWSPNRLDLQHQLFIQVSSKDAISNESPWGVRLADDIFSVSVNILEQPTEHNRPSLASSRKAIILLSNDSFAKDFMVFQVHLVRRSQSTAFTYNEKQPCAALIRCVGEYTLGSPADLFLAGGSFAFDLLAARRGTENDVDVLKYVASIGVVRRADSGLDAIAISASNIISIGSIPLPRSKGSPCPEVATYWLAEIAEALNMFVWTIQLSNGSLICWSVTFVGTLVQHNLLVRNSSVDTDASRSHFLLKTLVKSGNVLLGSHCTTGSTETWMQVSSATTKQEIPLGPLPGSEFGVVLVSGQACKRLHRQLRQDFEKDHFSADFLGYEIFGPSDFMLLPPAIVSALFMFLQNQNQSSGTQVQQHLTWRLGSYPFLDSAMIALRVLALRIVELYASSQGTIANPLLLESVTRLARVLWSPLQFAAFFLELGRQLEAKCFDYLHPLPDPHVKELSDLIDVILQFGCLEVAVASLPLLEDRTQSSALCTFILNHCLKKLTKPTGEEHFPEEEAKIISDMFRYGVKLSDPTEEDADIFVHQNNDDTRQIDSSRLQRFEYDNGDDDDERNRASYFCGLSKFFSPSRPAKLEKKSTGEGASSTTSECYVDFNEDVELLQPQANEGLSSSSSNSPTPTAAGVVARHLLEPIFTKGLPDWPEVGRISELVLGNKTTSGVKACSDAHFSSLLEKTAVSSFDSWVPSGASPVGEVDRFLVQNLTSCPKRLSTEAAKAAYDIVFVLLAYEDVCEDMLEEVPGLLLLALVVGNCLGCVHSFCDGAHAEFFLIKRYMKALARLGENDSKPMESIGDTKQRLGRMNVD